MSINHLFLFTHRETKYREEFGKSSHNLHMKVIYENDLISICSFSVFLLSQFKFIFFGANEN